MQRYFSKLSTRLVAVEKTDNLKGNKENNLDRLSVKWIDGNHSEKMIFSHFRIKKKSIRSRIVVIAAENLK